MQKGPREQAPREKMWKLIQLSVVFAVLASNIHYRWTPNPYAASVVAFLAALFVTAIPIMISDLLRLGGRAWQHLSRLAMPSTPAPEMSERYPAAPATKLDFQDRPEPGGT